MTINKKPLVFVLEDNPAYRKLISRILQKNGFVVMLFENGKKAADMLRYVRPALIISDIEMPKMDGFEFNEYVREHFTEHEIPFIYISSTSCEHMKVKASELGATGMLDKPVSTEKLKEAINYVLEIGR